MPRVTITASGLANVAVVPFFIGLVAGDTLFLLAHVLIGYAGGAGLKALAHGQHGAVGPLLLAVSALVVVGLAGWFLLRRRTARRLRPPVAATVQAWEEASCPLCLALEAWQMRHEARHDDLTRSTVARPQ